MQGTIRNLTLSLALAGLCSIGVAAQTGGNANASNSASQSSGKMNASDRIFVRKAAAGGLAEVELGKLAAERALSQDVKHFGQRMVDDHTKANDQLKQVASEEGVELPDKLNAKDKATKDRLEKLSGKQFDRAYMRNMVTDHAKDVSEFRTESKTAKDPAVKDFAQQTLPTLEDHLKQAKTIAPQVSETRHKKTTSPSGTQ